ncbi:hypothetical protein [Lactimicrobium massiliense]|uniref:hypothetical protein n=1 Tax=Lactimicrobium massiliense TaxID=2161814 RepID=UPI000D55A575|nr:hypothetical protein [Lactimicrobium massiliense]
MKKWPWFHRKPGFATSVYSSGTGKLCAKAKEKALNVALNKITGRWDDTKLADLFDQRDPDDLKLTGFDDDELSDLFDSSKHIETVCLLTHS